MRPEDLHDGKKKRIVFILHKPLFYLRCLFILEGKCPENVFNLHLQMKMRILKYL